MAVMRAKMVVLHVEEYFYGSEGEKSQEILSLNAVSRTSPYPEGGADEDNTYALYTPTASVSISIANPALFGQFKVGDKYYVDFTKAAD